MLTEKSKNYFKKILIKRLDELSSENKETITHSENEKDELHDFVDQASVESDRDLNYHIRERESRLKIKIQDALERIESGSFGICEECGEKISEKRLKARPVTTLCIDCKKRQELMEKARGL